MPFTCYVTFEIRKRGMLRKKDRSPREPRTFETETDAKAFARAKLAEALVLFAGTINPHLLKGLIHPHMQPAFDVGAAGRSGRDRYGCRRRPQWNGNAHGDAPGVTIAVILAV